MSAVSALSSSAIGQTESAVEIYDRLASGFSPLYDALTSAPDNEVPSELRYEREGITDARMSAWLAGARPLRADILRATTLRYARPLDRSQGFALLLPHLSQQRSLARATRWLALDAIRSGDAEIFGQLMGAQSTLAQRSTEDHVMISSLVGLAIAMHQHSTMNDMIDRGELSQGAAALALAATAGTRTHEFMHLPEVLMQERDMTIQELTTIDGLSSEDRALRLSALGMTDDEALLSDIDLDEFKGHANAYYATCSAIVADPHAPGAKEAIATLEADLLAGKYGEVMKQLAPAIGKWIARALEYDEQSKALATKMQALADGSKKPADFLFAANFYAAAAAACVVLRQEEQAEIETIRLARASTPTEQIERTARLLDRLREPIIENVLRGSRAEGLSFPRTWQWRDFDFVNGLLRETMPGIQGAVRVALAHALLTDDVELALACVRVTQHYASVGTIGHSLVAEQIARDTVAALDALEDKRLLTTTAREQLGHLVAKFSTEDPFQYRRALELERIALANTPIWVGGEEGRNIQPFDEKKLRGLPPNQLAFLLAVQMRAQPELTALGCTCPLDGALLDVRSWFNLDALALAIAQRESYLQHLETTEVPSSSPLAGLTATEPLDLSRRMTEQVAVLARLQELAKPKLPATE